MSVLLKAHDNAAQKDVRLFGQAEARMPITGGESSETSSSDESPTASGPRLAQEPQSEIDRLQQQIAYLQAQLRENETEAKREAEAALESGREEGKKLALSLDHEKLDLLKRNIIEAQQILTDRTTGLQTLSLQIAQLAMSKIFGDKNRYADAVAQSINYRAGQLSEELIVAVRVSKYDFPDADALAALARQANRTDISIDPSLPSGACIFDLKLGRLDAGISPQWDRLSSFLAALSEEEMLL